MAKRWFRTEKIELAPPAEDAAPADELEDGETTKPHSLPRLQRPGHDYATVDDVRVAFEEIWERVDRVKVTQARRRRDTDRQIGNLPEKVGSLNFRMKILWWAGSVLLAGTLANVIAGAKYLYGKGGEDAETAYTLRTLVDSNLDQSKRLRVVEDGLLKLIQHSEDAARRERSRPDATTNSSTRGNK